MVTGTISNSELDIEGKKADEDVRKSKENMKNWLAELTTSDSSLSNFYICYTRV